MTIETRPRGAALTAADATASLTVRDDRTGQTYVLPIENGAIRATDLHRIKASPDDDGLFTYDPGFMATAAVKSAITYIDGDAGILRYRGYPIEELAEQCGFIETAYLLLSGELPSDQQLAGWQDEIVHHTFIHENIKKFIDGFRHDAHPMGMLMSTVAALSTFYPEAKRIADEAPRRKQVVRLIAKMPTIAAFAYRHAVGLPYAYPDNELTYTGNFLNMMWKTTELKYTPDPVLERGLDALARLADEEPVFPGIVGYDGDGFVTGLDFDLFIAAFESGDPSSDYDDVRAPHHGASSPSAAFAPRLACFSRSL